MTSNKAEMAVFLSTLLVVSVLVVFPMHDPDTFWHLANGRAMVEEGRIINEEIFSYTAHGTKYDNHEWLSQILLFFAYDIAGAASLLGFKVLVVVLTACMLFNIAILLGADRSSAFLLVVTIILAGIKRYVERPEIFSLFMLSVLMYLLYGFKEGKFKKPLYFIPVIFIFWSFLHAALYGVVFFAAFIVGETLGFYIKKRFRSYNSHTAPGSLRFLWFIFIVTIAVMTVNPYGFKVYGMFLKFIESTNVMNVLIAEFMPTPLHDFKLFWLILALVSILSLAFIKKIDITNLFVMLPFAALAVRYNRMTAIFLLVSLPSLAHCLRLINEGPYLKKWVRRLNLVLIAVAMVYIINIKFFTPNPYYFGYGVEENYQPVAAARFVFENGLKGNMYNDGHFGGYLAFHLYPERKILYMYNYPEVFNSVIDQLHNTKYLEGLNINYAITEDIGWLKLLFPNIRFVPVFWDRAAVVAVRDAPENRLLIDKYGLKYYLPGIGNDKLKALEANPDVLPVLVGEISNSLAFGNNTPLADHFGGLLLKNEDKISPSEGAKIAQKALKFNEKSAYLWASLGSFSYRAGDKIFAISAFQKALSIKKDLKSALTGLAYTAYDSGDYKTAENSFKKALKEDSKHIPSLFGLALVYQKTGQKSGNYDLAEKQWEEFLKLYPSGPWTEKAKENVENLRKKR